MPEPATAAGRVARVLSGVGGVSARGVTPVDNGVCIEIDLWLAPRSRRQVDAELRRHGFVRRPSRGHPGHAFYLGVIGGRLVKLDLRLEGRRTSARWWDRLARKVPTIRRPGPVIAVMGPDGAGKSTLIERLAAGLRPVGVSCVYLGVNRPQKRRSEPGAARPVTRAPWVRALREPLFVVRKVLRALPSALTVLVYRHRGRVVVTDRHPLDVLATRPRETWLGRWLEEINARHGLVRPDRIILLDAPAEVLVGRKKEHDLKTIEAWRAAYRSALEPMGARIIDTTVGIDGVVDASVEVVWEALRGAR